MNNPYLAKLTHTRAVQTAVSRMAGQVAGDMAAAMGHKELGRLQAGMAIAVKESTDEVEYMWDKGGATFDETNPPAGYRWWVPDEDEPPPSLMNFSGIGDAVKTDHAHQGTSGGNGTGKVVTVWDGVRFVLKASGRLLARVEQKLDGVPGYRGFVAKSISRKVVGRAASGAIATVFSNTFSQERRKSGRRWISTRRWRDNKFVGRHCGYAAYYRPRGRPALPELEAIARRIASEKKRRKGGKSRNKKSGFQQVLYKTKRPRPTVKEWHAMQRSPIVGTARVMNHRRGKAWVDGFENFVTEHLDKEPDDIAADVGNEVASVIKKEAVQPFFKWLTKGAKAQRPRTQNQPVNTPDRRF